MSNVISFTKKKFETLSDADLQIRINFLTVLGIKLETLVSEYKCATKDMARYVPELEGVLEPLQFQIDYVVACVQESRMEQSNRKENG